MSRADIIDRYFKKKGVREMNVAPKSYAVTHNMGSVASPHYVVDVEHYEKLYAELAAAIEQRDKALAFLQVYRNDTPLGNQPHMLAHEVDLFLKECWK